MRKVPLFISIFFFSGAAFCAPTITDVTLNDKGIEIKGSGFGANNPMLFWDDAKDSFDRYNAAQGDVIAAAPLSNWKNTGSKSSNIFQYDVSAQARTGRKDLVYHGEGHRLYLGSPLHPKTTRLNNHMYVSWWYKPSKSPSGEGGSNKFIRIWDNSSGYGTRISWTQMHFTCIADEEYVTWGNWKGNINEWNHHEILVDLEAGKVQTRVNGNIIHDAKCGKHSSYKNVPLSVQAIGFEHNLHNYQQMETFLDDIYIADSQARVEISDSPKWSATMRKEIMPISSWSNNKIVAMPLDGKIHLSNNAYVYVVDSEGVANKTGIKMACPKCPKPALSNK